MFGALEIDPQNSGSTCFFFGGWWVKGEVFLENGWIQKQLLVSCSFCILSKKPSMRHEFSIVV